MKLRILLITGALLASVSLSGCVMLAHNDASHPVTVTSKPKPSKASAEPVVTPIPTPTAIPGDLDGNGSLSAWEQEQISKSVYTMPDGSVIPIPNDQPLPAPVVEAVKAQIAPLQSAFATSSGNAMGPADKAFGDARQSMGYALNRVIITVSYIRTNGAWGVSNEAGGAISGQARDQAVAYANAFAAQDPNRYVVLVFER